MNKLLITATLMSAVTVNAATNIAASVAREDVLAAINASVNGDTVSIPAGGALWTNGITITNGVNIIGDVIATNTWISNNLSDGSCFLFDTASNQYPRLAYVRLVDGGQPANTSLGFIRFIGYTPAFRIDHCVIDNVEGLYIRVAEYARGLIDHNVFIGNDGDNFIEVWHDEWANGSWGDESWSSPLSMGTTNQAVFEDNVIRYTGGSALAETDTYGGARMTVRFNDFYDTTGATHGTGDGSGRNRGPVHTEWYFNRYWATNGTSSRNIIHIRGGTGIIFGERATNYTKGPTLHTYRLEGVRSCTPFGTASGTNAFDVNDPAGVFASGTAGAGSGSVTLVVPGAGWTAGQWKGYIAYVPVSSVNPNGYFASSILDNTTDTITVQEDNFTNTCPHIFVSGEPFEIRQIILGLDMVGAGRSGELLDKSVTPTPTNLNQALQPMYLWDNRLDGVLDTVSPGNGSDLTIRNDFHYYCQTNGTFTTNTGGVGFGSYEEMLTITPNYATNTYRNRNPGFWATNAPNSDWNKLNDSETDGALYVFNDSGSWELYYTPLEYPHPASGFTPTDEPSIKVTGRGKLQGRGKVKLR